MNRIGLLAAALLASAFLSPVMAFSKTTTLYEKGGWQVFGGRADDNQPVCGMLTEDHPFSKMLTIKYFPYDDGHLAIQMFKTSWRIPSYVKTKIAIQIDNRKRWIAHAHGLNNKTISGLEVLVSGDPLVKFLNEMKDGSFFRVHFFEGTEEDWHGSLSGSSAALEKFFSCAKYVRELVKKPEKKTQPYSSRPYSGRRTQPFAPHNAGSGDRAY